MWPRRAKSTGPARAMLPGDKVVKPRPVPARPATAPKPVATKRSRIGEDVLLGLFGTALGLGCALFPWYVFFNQEKFGIRAVEFQGDGPATGVGTSSAPLIARSGDAPSIKDLATVGLDQLATGTTPKENEPKSETPSILEQPFPTQDVPFRLVHIANGRAMIEDAAGLWIVQRGSVLPDMSRVASIEEREGEWVIVTSTDRVVALSR